MKNSILFLYFLASLSSQKSYSGIIRVPGNVQTIQEAINQAGNSDTILVSKGTYYENLVIETKEIVLASDFLFSKDTKDINATIIDGHNGPAVFRVINTTVKTHIIGFTIKNAGDGVSVHSKISFISNIVRNCSDGLDYESKSGGICRNNVFELNSDDGIDLDDDVDIVISNNIISNNGDDGIEIRLQPYTGKHVNAIIQNNLITNNGEDGIQIIDYPDTSDRIISIKNNIIANSAKAAIGCMGEGNTRENYEAAQIAERIYIINNTIIKNSYGICGGGNSIVLNNTISNTQYTALKGIEGNSVVAYQHLHLNGRDIDDCNILKNSIVNGDPKINENYNLSADSPLLGNGSAKFSYNGEVHTVVIDQTMQSVNIGALETGLSSWMDKIGPN